MGKPLGSCLIDLDGYSLPREFQAVSTAVESTSTFVSVNREVIKLIYFSTLKHFISSVGFEEQ